MAVVIRTVTHAQPALVDAFARLVPQLSASSPAPTLEQLEEIAACAESDLFVAELDGQIVGALTLATYRIPTGLKAWIEDVVVDESARGHRVGEALNRAALDSARARGAKHVSLTSRPSRAAANRLYRRIGFTPYDTNIYRYTL